MLREVAFAAYSALDVGLVARPLPLRGAAVWARLVAGAAGGSRPLSGSGSGRRRPRPAPAVPGAGGGPLFGGASPVGGPPGRAAADRSTRHARGPHPPCCR